MSEGTARDVSEAVKGKLKDPKTINEQTPNNTTEIGGEKEPTTVHQQTDGITIGDGTGKTNQTPTDQNTNPLDNHANKDNTAKLNNPKPDSDWGHIDDDKFKIQDGDIIEYLMKEVILESAAWCLNKVSGIAGVAAYEITRTVYHAAIKYPWNTWVAPALTDAANWTWNGTKKLPKKIWNAIVGKNQQAVPPAGAPVPPTNPNAGNYSNNPEDNYRLITQEYHNKLDKLAKLRGIDANSQAIKDTKDAYQQLYRQIAKGFIEYKEDTGELICLADNKPYPIHLSKEAYTSIKQQTELQMVEFIKSGLSSEEKNKYSDEQLKSFITTTQEYNVAYFKYKDGNGPEPEKPVIPLLGGQNFQTVYEKAKDTLYPADKDKQSLLSQEYTKIAKLTNDMSIATELFATHYAQFIISEDYRLHPNAYKGTKKMQTKEKEYLSAFNEGKKIFLQAEAARLHGEPIVSREKLLETVEKMATESTKLAEDPQGNKEKVENQISSLIKPYEKEEPVKLPEFDPEKIITLKEADLNALSREEASCEATLKKCKGDLDNCADLRSRLGLPPRRGTSPQTNAGSKSNTTGGHNKTPTNQGR